MVDIATATRAYLICALWSGLDENNQPLEESFDLDDVSEEAQQQAWADVVGFTEVAGADLDGLDDEQIGHDFYLTRNGHGAGFWDRGLGERGDRLSAAAKTFGEANLYAGDDGLLYF